MNIQKDDMVQLMLTDDVVRAKMTEGWISDDCYKMMICDGEVQKVYDVHEESKDSPMMIQLYGTGGLPANMGYTVPVKVIVGVVHGNN